MSTYPNGGCVSIRGVCVALFALASVAAAQDAPSPASITNPDQYFPSYEPKETQCGCVPLVRPANALSQGERVYVKDKTRKSGRSLRDFLDSTGEDFQLTKPPVLGLVSSGGGYRSMFNGAGLVQAFDERDSQSKTKGLYQAFTYHTGLSGGTWLLFAIIGNGLDKISSIQRDLWSKRLVKNSVYPLNTAAAVEGPRVAADAAKKNQAGFNSTITDIWGRFIGFQTLRSQDVDTADTETVYTLSNVKKTQAFRQHEMPFPIVTSLGVGNINSGNCDAEDEATQYEFNPYEFGSWDDGIAAFTPTRYLGTNVENGRPAIRNKCTTNFDQLSFILGTSSHQFNQACGQASTGPIFSVLSQLLPPGANGTPLPREQLFARYPNPFKGYSGSGKVNSQKELYLVDGGQANQNDPLWPLLQPERNVDAVVVNDNSADTDDNWPNGTEIYRTYEQSKRAGLTRMPVIPDANTFVSQKLNKRAVFFGCGDKDKLSIVYLPNSQYAAKPANIPTGTFDFEQQDSQAIIDNGVLIATQNGDPEWPLCLGCALAESSASLPKKCGACFDKYCYKG